MKERIDRIGGSIGYLDFGTNEEMRITKSVDITDECLNKALLGEEVILDFSQGTAGVLVRIVFCFSGKHESSELVKYLDQLTELEGKDLLTYTALADMFGIPFEQLIFTICDEAPPRDRNKFRKDFQRYSLAPDSQFDELLKKAGLTTSDLIT